MSAIAKVIDGEYRLMEVPSVEEHVCWVSGDPHLVKSAISHMLQAIERDPTRSINQIYEDVRLSFTQSMSMAERKSFLDQFPTFKAVQRQLYLKRRELIPRNPATMKELQIDLPWFLTDQKENLVKGDRVFDDGRRVILLTTNDLLEILAKAPQILGDGTFRITPTQWYQTFIVSVQVSPGVFVPVCFALLPDKKRESYDAMFTMLKEALDSRQLELSATFFMSYFECAIQDSFVRQRKFSKKMIDYVSKYRINGSFPPTSWSMYQHSG